MYADCVASTSRLAFQDIWDPPASDRFFPVSDCRYESRVPDAQPRRASTALHLQATTKPSASVVLPAATPTYSTTLPTRTQISPGIFTDGKNLLFSPAHPEVQGLLAAARSSLTLPKPSSEVIFTLSALEVFYRPADPVHWLFWSDDRKFATADVVTRISLHNPPLIISSVAWNGKPEYLSILATHHGVSWRQLYETEPWFSVVVPPKPSTPPRQLNLRKRKVAAGAFKEASLGLEEIDEDDLLPGRADSRPPSPQPMNDADAPAVKKRPQRSRAVRSKTKAPTPSPVASMPPSPAGSVLTLSPDQMSAEVYGADAVGAATAEAGTRSRRKVGPPSHYTQPVSCATAHEHPPLHPPLQASLLLGPGVHPAQGMASMALLPGPGVSGHGTHARTRSTSSDFSGKTAVGSGSSRSASVASGASTAVDAGSPSKKRKALEEDVDTLAGHLDIGDIEMEGDDDAESVSVAIGRTKRSRKANPASGVDDASTLSEKGKAAKTTPAPRASRKKARKA